MSEFVDVVIAVDGQNKRVGTVTVTREQFDAAIKLWDSEDLTTLRTQWCEHSGETKVFWKGERCYPPKKIMRLASRDGVRDLTHRVSDLQVRQQLTDGLEQMERSLRESGKLNRGRLERGYQVLETYDGTAELGYEIQSVSTIQKKKFGY